VSAYLLQSTLLNLIQSKLDPSSGYIHVNPQLRLGIFTQHHLDSFDLSLSPLQVSNYVNTTSCYSYTSTFLLLCIQYRRFFIFLQSDLSVCSSLSSFALSLLPLISRLALYFLTPVIASSEYGEEVAESSRGRHERAFRPI
jgi:hypothetical protein